MNVWVFCYKLKRVRLFKVSVYEIVSKIVFAPFPWTFPWKYFISNSASLTLPTTRGQTVPFLSRSSCMSFHYFPLVTVCTTKLPTEPHRAFTTRVPPIFTSHWNHPWVLDSKLSLKCIFQYWILSCSWHNCRIKKNVYLVCYRDSGPSLNVKYGQAPISVSFTSIILTLITILSSINL